MTVHLLASAPAGMSPAQADDAAAQLEQDLVEIVREEMGMHERQAYEFAAALVRGMRKRYGGERLGTKGLYIPAPSKAERNEAIRREYTGANGPEVMRRHGIKRSRLFEIVAARPPGAARIGVSSAKSPVPSLQTGQVGG